MFEKDSVVLIPSYQPETTLVNLTRGLKEEGFQVVVVDDGSGPSFSSIFEKCKANAIVIGYEKNRPHSPISIFRGALYHMAAEPRNRKLRFWLQNNFGFQLDNRRIV